MSQVALGTNSVLSCHLLPSSIQNLQKPGGMVLRAGELKDPGGPWRNTALILLRTFIIPPCDF